MDRESPHMQFVYEGIFQGQAWRDIALPIERPADKQASAVKGNRAPWMAAGNGGAGGVEKDPVSIESVPAVTRAIDTPAVGESFGQADDLDMPMIPRSVASWMKGDFSDEFTGNIADHKPDTGAMPRQEHEIHPAGRLACAKRKTSSTRMTQ
jgi:hypothetical protein